MRENRREEKKTAIGTAVTPRAEIEGPAPLLWPVDVGTK